MAYAQSVCRSGPHRQSHHQRGRCGRYDKLGTRLHIDSFQMPPGTAVTETTRLGMRLHSAPQPPSPISDPGRLDTRPRREAPSLGGAARGGRPHQPLSFGSGYISLTNTFLRPPGTSVTAAVPWNSALKEPHLILGALSATSDLMILLPPASSASSSPIAAAGSASVALARQMDPNIASLTWKLRPTSMSRRPPSIIGSLPRKPKYCTCHGNVSVRIVAVPVSHGPIDA